MLGGVDVGDVHGLCVDVVCVCGGVHGGRLYILHTHVHSTFTHLYILHSHIFTFYTHTPSPLAHTHHPHSPLRYGHCGNMVSR